MTMRLLSKILTALLPDSDTRPAWRHPRTERDIADILAASARRPQLIYKHSPSCGVSWIARSRLESAWDRISELAECHTIDVIADRALSSHVASVTNVPHQSPQLLVVRDGRVVWHASHGQVRSESALQALSDNVGTP